MFPRNHDFLWLTILDLASSFVFIAKVVHHLETREQGWDGERILAASTQEALWMASTKSHSQTNLETVLSEFVFPPQLII